MNLKTMEEHLNEAEGYRKDAVQFANEGELCWRNGDSTRAEHWFLHAANSRVAVEIEIRRADLARLRHEASAKAGGEVRP